MKQLLALLLSMTFLLAACGGLQEKLDGKQYIAEIGPKGAMKKLGYISFKEDKVTFSSDETKVKRKGTVKYGKDDKDLTIKLDDNPIYKNGAMKLKHIKENDEGLEAVLEVYSNGKKVDFNQQKMLIKLSEKEGNN